MVALLVGPNLLAKVSPLPIKGGLPFWLYCSTRLAVDLAGSSDENVFAPKAQGLGVSLVEQFLVGYAGPGALDECLLLVRPAGEKGNGPRKKARSQVSAGVKDPLIHLAYVLFTRAHGKKIMDYGAARCGDLFCYNERIRERAVGIS